MKLSNIRLEVMQTIEKSMDDLLIKYLKRLKKIGNHQIYYQTQKKPGFLKR